MKQIFFNGSYLYVFLTITKFLGACQHPLTYQLLKQNVHTNQLRSNCNWDEFPINSMFE